jgi:uncharacterized protein (TIGR02246 family)
MREKQTEPIASGNDTEIKSIHEVVSKAEVYQNIPDEFCKLFTKDAIITNVAGLRIIGRDEFYEVMKKAMKTSLAEVITRNEVVDITFIRHDVAIVSCYKHLVEKGKLDEDASKASLTFVMVKEQNNWLIASAQSTFVKK